MADNTFVVVLSATRIAALRKLAGQQGIIATQHGEIDAHGVKLGYSINDDYHPADGSSEVTITVLHKPLFVPEGIVEEKIHEFLDQIPEDVPVEQPHVTVGQVAAPLTQDGFSEGAEAPPLTPEDGDGTELPDDDENSEGGPDEPVEPVGPVDPEEAPEPEGEDTPTPGRPKRVSKKK
jgi:hypothetical protein